MTVHKYMRFWDDYPTETIPPEYHAWDGSGTKHRCEELVETDEGTWLCPRPAYHKDHGVPCGPLTGLKLW